MMLSNVTNNLVQNHDILVKKNELSHKNLKKKSFILIDFFFIMFYLIEQTKKLNF